MGKVISQRLLAGLDAEYGHSTQQQRDTGYDQHHRLRTTYERENHTSEQGSNNLGQANRAVEQPQLGTHRTTRERVGQKGKGHGQHGGPCATNQEVGDK